MLQCQILEPTLLDTHPDIARSILAVRRRLGLTIGWHYALDLTWIAHELRDLKPGSKILDAGGGMGIFQWWAAAQGHHVWSVDAIPRTRVPPRFERWCRVRFAASAEGIDQPTVTLKPATENDQAPGGTKTTRAIGRAAIYRRGLTNRLRDRMASVRSGPQHSGSVTLVHGDLADLSGLDPIGFDAAVSVSAIEHNERDKVRQIVRGLHDRIQAGPVLATVPLHTDLSVSAYHEPSHGWAFGAEDLHRLFGVPNRLLPGQGDVDESMARLRGSRRLQRLLDPFYATGGSNGMPWGIWDPTYLPLGLRLD